MCADFGIKQNGVAVIATAALIVDQGTTDTGFPFRHSIRSQFFAKLVAQCRLLLHPRFVQLRIEEGNLLEHTLVRGGQCCTSGRKLAIDRESKALGDLFALATGILIFALKLTVTVGKSGEAEAATRVELLAVRRREFETLGAQFGIRHA